MSPASSGNFEVERYIGACLISSQQSRNFKKHGGVQQQQQQQQDLYHHQQHQQQQQQRRVVQRPHKSEHQQHVPQWVLLNAPPVVTTNGGSALSRLAFHTQGIPLILSNNNNNGNSNGFNNGKYRRHGNAPKKVKDQRTLSADGKEGQQKLVCGEQQQQQQQCTDTVSVTSDESGSTNTSSFSSGNSDNCLPRIIKPRKRRKKDRKTAATPTLVQHSLNHYSGDVEQQQQQHLVNNFNFDEQFWGGGQMSTPDFSDVFDTGGEFFTCQCKCCDPSRQIWDIDRSCYSPLLTSPASGLSPFRFPEMQTSLSSASSSNDEVPTLDSLSLDDDERSSSFSSSKASTTSSSSCGDCPVEVSTEIVTFLNNGHRDLEIKFFKNPTLLSQN